MADWTAILAVMSIGSFVLSTLTLLGRSLDKNLSIREYEAYRIAVHNDIMRVEQRLLDIERSRPTTGELQIVANSLNKRLDEMKRD